MFIQGLAVAALGSICIGIGQTLQKLALNRIAQQHHLPTQTLSVSRRRYAKAIQPQLQLSGFERFSNKLWLAGISLSYFGELGNWIALSFASAAVVTPLGIVSVLTNVFLAQRFLGEQISQRQRRGYMFVLVGVLGILIVAPKGESWLGNSTTEVLNSCAGAGMVNSFTLLFIVQTLLVYHIFVNQVHQISLYVAVCSLFGTLTIISAKIMSLLVSLSSAEALTNTSNMTSEAAALNHSALTMHTLQSPASTLSSVSPQASLIASLDSVRSLDSARSGSSEVGFAYMTFSVIIALSIGAQEVFKQQALSRFPVSRFPAHAYAGFNGCVVMSSVLVFGETATGFETFVFVVSFSICMIAVVTGISIVQSDDQVVVSSTLAKHT
ncbi:hypothetical protein BSLG_008851 [Batrachochytrium salamandrivorans]|nr:hypothetical protein BSLG_008851 [Batrachochytrium salamandrivorans]